MGAVVVPRDTPAEFNGGRAAARRMLAVPGRCARRGGKLMPLGGQGRADIFTAKPSLESASMELISRLGRTTWEKRLEGKRGGVEVSGTIGQCSFREYSVQTVFDVAINFVFP